MANPMTPVIPRTKLAPVRVQVRVLPATYPAPDVVHLAGIPTRVHPNVLADFPPETGYLKYLKHVQEALALAKPGIAWLLERHPLYLVQGRDLIYLVLYNVHYFQIATKLQGQVPRFL